MTTGVLDDDIERLVEDAKAKCERGEIDAALRDMIARLKELGLCPAFCDGAGNPIAPGHPRAPGFTLRVGSISCRNL
jgi:hypothetical protein